MLRIHTHHRPYFPTSARLAFWAIACFAVSVSLRQSASAQTPNPDSPKQPNIVFIMADDLGIEGLGCYGGLSYATPNLDELASTGLRFAHAHAQPLCTNTRLQLMTGLHNDKNWLYFGILDPQAKTIGHYFQDAGYRSCIAGKWQLQSYDPPDYPGSEKRRGTGMHPKDAGFDTYSLYHSLHTEDKGSRYADPTWLEDGTLEHAPGEYGPDKWVDYINDFMEAETKRDEPFFVYYAMALPHWPFNPTPDSKIWADPTKRLEEDNQYFKDMVEYTDKCVGRVVQKIDDLGIRDETLIIFYSDNGTHREIISQTKTGPVKGDKAGPTDAGTHVPLIASWPGKIRSGLSQSLVDSTDFLPTFMEAAGKRLPADHGLDGISFYDHLLNPNSTAPQRQSIYSFYDPRPGWDKDQFRLHISARDRRWKLYSDDQLFDLNADILEHNAIKAENDTAETKAVRQRLSKVIADERVN